MTRTSILPHLPEQLIRSAYAAAPGNEIESGKFASPGSSAALAANGFGFFLERPDSLPCPHPSLADDWTPDSVHLEAEVRFPWSGGRHPWLDALVSTRGHILGFESKRYEPFRSKSAPAFSTAFDRPVWGPDMTRYLAVRDALTSGTLAFRHLDAAQLVKHALALRTASAARDEKGRHSVLLYLFAEPEFWSNGRAVSRDAIARHRDEVETFSRLVAGDEVPFLSLSWYDLLSSWEAGPTDIRPHARVVREYFSI